MKYILVFDKTDEQRMHNGEMIQIPGQVETFITMEPKKRRVEVEPISTQLIGYRKAARKLPMVKCKDCGRSFKGNIGLSTHARQCSGK